MRLAPFGALVITSIIVPRASFLGHLSGIVMGYFMAYAMYPLTTNTLSSLALLAFLLAGEQGREPSLLAEYCLLSCANLD